MKFELSEENSKRVLAGTKWITNASQNYLTSLNNNSAKPTSSGKKLINAFLLVPVIVPTAITLALVSCTYLFLNAVSTQDNDTKLSKVAKGTARALIYVAAAVILIPCIVLNLIISLIPFLIFLAINKDIFSQKDIEKGEAQTTSQVTINDGEEYSKRVKEEILRFGQQDDVCQPFMRSGQRYNQPNIEIISQVVEGVDQTIIANNINNDDVQNGKTLLRTIGNDHSVSMQGIITGDLRGQQKGFATGFSFQCNILPENGVDLQFGMSMRTEDTQQEATQALMQSESARTLLSSESGILSIEQSGSSQRK